MPTLTIIIIGRQHGTLYSSNGYGLALTHTHALVWPYASATPSPETFVFTLPYPSKHASDPLPLGSLVSPSAASDEPGLVVVMPVSGKIAYWEYISSAATLDFLRQQRNGVEETIPGMYSGEQVVQIMNADSASFILSLSSGRLAHMSVRDGQGKPAITVQFLRDTVETTAAWPNVFGSIRNALKHAVQRGGDVAAVRADGASKIGPRNIVAASRTGRLQAWRVQRSGHHETLANVDAREAIIGGLYQVLPPIGSNVDFEVIDFTFVPRGMEAKYTDISRLSQALHVDDDSIQHLLLLVSLSNKRQSQYALVEVVLQGQTFDVGMIRIISSYTSPVSSSTTERPRLHLPRPGLVAFLVFDRAVVIASITSPPDSPDSQLQEESNVMPATFEDVIDLRNEGSFEIVGSGMEEPLGPGHEPETSRSHRPKIKNPTALLMVRGVGVIRVAITDIDRFASERPPQVTARNKLEQAVFFGLKDDNPLVFEGRRELPFSDSDIGEAALELSQDILASSLSNLTTLPPSLEANMRQRIAYLDRLMAHLNAQKVKLDRQTRWGLLCNAEKMHLAKEIWKMHETFLADRPDNDKKTIVSEIVEFIHEDEKKNPNRAVGEVDRVRLWFIHDVWRMEIFVPWAYQMIKYLHKNRVDDAVITRFLYEGGQLTYVTLHGALEYRRRNLDFYGLGGEVMRYGILARQRDYVGLPEFWTSTFFISNNVLRLTELSHAWLDRYYNKTALGSVESVLVQSIRDSLPKLTDQYIITLNEYNNWAEVNGDSSQQQMAAKVKAYLDDVHITILKLRDYGLWDEAIDVAEKHDSIRALAELLASQIALLRIQMDDRGTSREDLARQGKQIKARQEQMVGFIGLYGEEFAFQAYQLLLDYGGIQAVLDFAGLDKQGFATKFLRDGKELGKISWINDVEREHDLDTAAQTLLSVGEAEEQLWSKKIELSLGKLALMAEDSGDTPVGDGSLAKHDVSLVKVERDLDLIAIQDMVHRMILPVIKDAVDDEAAVELAMLSLAPKTTKKLKVLIDDLQSALGQLVSHSAMKPEALIDLLTLMRADENLQLPDEPFFLALRVADLGLQGDSRQQAQRLIWRRCLNRDDWSRINSTENLDDMAVIEALGRTQAYSTMESCVLFGKFIQLAFDLTCANANSMSDLEEGQENFPYITRPSECLGVYTDPSDPRYSNQDDSLRERHVDAMKAEDALLKKYVEKYQLDKWARAAFEAARRTATYGIDAATAAADINSNGNANGNGNGHLKANGDA